MDLAYPTILEKCISTFAENLHEFIKSASEVEDELPTKEECKAAIEEVYSGDLVELYNAGNLATIEDIDTFLFIAFENRENYGKLLRCATKAMLIHVRNVLK